MAGGTQPLQKQQQQHQQQQHKQQQPPQTPTTKTTAATATTTADEEALKRNTDCVYFLASPLTCKKGAECEYRHSEVARVNPRDCWFWLNGSCLNPKCGYRHPPLDGLLGTQVSTPVGSSLPSSQTLPIPVTSAPHSSGKQAVPCIFFQQGYCLKGDRCPFSHGPPSTVNKKVPQRPAATTVLEPPTLKKPFGGLEKCTQEQKFPQANFPKSADLTSKGTPQAKAETAPPKNGVTYDRYLAPRPVYVAPPPVLDDQPSRYRPTDIPPATNGDSMSRSNRVQQIPESDDLDTLNSRDADEFSREPSPGFDVLVDDELGDSDYYHNEDHYGRTGSHEKRNLNAMSDYDMDPSADYDSIVDVDRDRYRDSRGYDSYDRMRGQYVGEKRRVSSERNLGGSAHLERRRYPRADSPDQVADLRHHLSKQRKANGLRSVISHDYAHDNHAEDRSHRGPSRRDAHHLPPSDTSVSNRLRGRIQLPGRSSSPVNGIDLHPGREMDRGRNWGRLSPGRPQVSTHQGRLRDRIKGRVQEDISNEGRSFGGPRMRDLVNNNNPDFVGPKRLAELKGGKIAVNKEQQMNDQQSLSLGKRKYPVLENHQQSESDLLFEGPKPLSEILKRKRVAETTVPGNGLMSGNKEDNTPKKDEEKLTRSLKTTAGVHNNEEETEYAYEEEIKSGVGQSPLQRNVSEIETEEGIIVEEPAEVHEPQSFDQRDGESDYEQIDGEDYNLDEAENAEGEEEYLDDDNGDDFAKKIGVMFS